MTARQTLIALGADPDDVAAMTLTQVLAAIAERTKLPMALATSKPKAQ